LQNTALAIETLGPPTTPNGGTIYSFIRTVLSVVTKIAIPALVVAIVFFGLQILLAQGDERALDEAKKKLFYILGITTVFLGLGLIATIIYNTGSSVGYVKLF
jgi:hypothetical protein